MAGADEHAQETSAVGVWYVPAATVARIAAGPPPIEGLQPPAPFFYDGATVTLALAMSEDWAWHSDDGIYRLQVRWDGEEVLLRTPFEGWKYFVTMKDDVFHRYELSIDWVFKRARGDKLLARFASLTRPRDEHDYAINLLGEREEGWQDDIDG